MCDLLSVDTSHRNKVVRVTALNFSIHRCFRNISTHLHESSKESGKIISELRKILKDCSRALTGTGYCSRALTSDSMVMILGIMVNKLLEKSIVVAV